MGDPEVWLRGSVAGYDRSVMPAVHALIQVREDVERLAGSATLDELWQRPGGAAAAGFHLHHLAGALDRLFTYARGEQLTDAQKDAMRQEGQAQPSADELVALVRAAVDRALAQLRDTPPSSIFDAREVGRAKLPATVIGLLFHGAEHSTRHVGQFLTTLKIVRGLR
jgi:hypothetical protein